MPRLALLIEYDGTAYAGWQRQNNGITVQQRVEQSLRATYGEECSIHGAGRTDAGVHASGQVAHVELSVHAHDVPINKVAVALNTRLPKDIRINNVAVVSPTFHARFDAQWREYIYTIALTESVFDRLYCWHPDVPFQSELLLDALHIMVGEHDFTAISKCNPATKSYICDVTACEGRITHDLIEIRIRANRFVYGMCRAIVGAAMNVARGHSSLSQLRDQLASGSRHKAPSIVPAHGLRLSSVGYATEIFADLQTNIT